MVEVSLWFIYSCLLLALQVKVGKVASFVGKIFVVQCSTTHKKPRVFFPMKNYPLYGIIIKSLSTESCQS